MLSEISKKLPCRDQADVVRLCLQLAVSLYHELFSEGSKYGIRNVGCHALGCLRVEKGYPLLGKELTAFVTPFEAGMANRVDLQKVKLFQFLFLLWYAHSYLSKQRDSFIFIPFSRNHILSICLPTIRAVTASVRQGGQMPPLNFESSYGPENMNVFETEVIFSLQYIL